MSRNTKIAFSISWPNNLCLAMRRVDRERNRYQYVVSNPFSILVKATGGVMGKSHVKQFTAPVGYVVNLYNLPKWIRFLASTYGRHLEPTVLHQLMYDTFEASPETFYTASKIYYVALDMAGVNWCFKTLLKVLTSRFFGGRRRFLDSRISLTHVLDPVVQEPYSKHEEPTMRRFGKSPQSKVVDLH